jgi:hypothetical protein
LCGWGGVSACVVAVGCRAGVDQTPARPVHRPRAGAIQGDHRCGLRSRRCPRRVTASGTASSLFGPGVVPSRNVVRNDINGCGLGGGTTTAVLCPFCRDVFTPVRGRRYVRLGLPPGGRVCRHRCGAGRGPVPMHPAAGARSTNVRAAPPGAWAGGGAWRAAGPRLCVGFGGLCRLLRRPVAVSDLCDRRPDPPVSR